MWGLVEETWVGYVREGVSGLLDRRVGCAEF